MVSNMQQAVEAVEGKRAEMDNRIQATGMGLENLAELWTAIAPGLRNSARDHVVRQALEDAMEGAKRALFVKQCQRVVGMLTGLEGDMPVVARTLELALDNICKAGTGLNHSVPALPSRPSRAASGPPLPPP